MSNIEKTDLILVTGSNGGLGQVLISALSQAGYKNLLAPSRTEMDLLSRKSTSEYFKKFKPEAVFHLASLVYGLLGNLENQFLSAFQNTEINSNLMLSISEEDVKYVFFAGTVASYPYPYAKIPLSESNFFMGLPHSGEFGYAMAKRHAYTYLKILKESKDLEFTYGIFTNLYGENDRFNIHSGHVIPSLVAKACNSKMENNQFKVWGDGSAIRDFMHFHDAARAAIFCMENRSFDLINISSGMGISIGEIANKIANFFEIENINFSSDKPTGINRRIVDNSKLINMGFNLEIPISDGIMNLCDWYFKNYQNVRT
jgi:GDP-L-fucose synthase